VRPKGNTALKEMLLDLLMRQFKDAGAGTEHPEFASRAKTREKWGIAAGKRALRLLARNGV
jgi:hypothetical protein